MIVRASTRDLVLWLELSKDKSYRVSASHRVGKRDTIHFMAIIRNRVVVG